MSTPKVSVIVPYYNHGRHLHQTVHAALRATKAPLEVIVVDDGSKEPKAETYLNLVQSLSPAVKVVRQSNQGLSAARNAGLAIATGAYVQLLDSDDLLSPGKIDLQLKQMESQPQFDISITNYLLCDESGTLFSRDGDPISRFDFTLDDFLFRWERGFSIPIHCALFRRGVFEGIPFETSVVGKEDWIFWCRQAHAGRRFGYLPIYGAIYRQHGGGMSKSYQAMGDSWLRAAEVIETVLAGQNTDFMPACKDWYEEFYEPLIAKQKRGESAASIDVSVTASDVVQAPGEAPPLDLDWVDALAAVRKAKADRPFVSIIIPVYNHFEYLRECLTSALLQEARGSVEVVIVDDGSRDPRIRPLLQAVVDRLPGVTLILNTQNLGIAESQNRAAAAAKGEFIAWLDCDDSLAPDALARLSDILETSVDYVFTDREDIDEAGRRLRIAAYGGYPSIKPGGSICDDLVDGMIASHLKVMRRSAYLDLGGSDPRLSGVQDWDLALRFAAAGNSFAYVPQVLYRHRIHTRSVTSGDSVRQFWLTNIVRRDHFLRTQPRRLSEAGARSWALRACRALVTGGSVKGDRVLVIRKMGKADQVAELKKAWVQSRACLYAADADASVEELNLVREYNSYFDAVLAPDEAVASFFLGYMWDHDALILAHDLRSMDVGV